MVPILPGATLALLPLAQAQKASEVGEEYVMNSFEINSVIVGVVVATVGSVIVVAVLMAKRRPDTKAGILRYAGISQKLLFRIKRDGLDIKKAAVQWKSLNPTSGFNTWMRFAKISAWKQKMAFRYKVSRLSQSKETRHLTALLLAVGTPENDLRNQNLVEMAHLWNQDVRPEVLGSAAENDIDSTLMKWITDNANNMRSLKVLVSA